MIESGFEIKSFNSFNLNYDSEIAKVTHDSLIQTISSIDLTDVDSIFVSCTALKVIDIIETLESKISTDTHKYHYWFCECSHLLKVIGEK